MGFRASGLGLQYWLTLDPANLPGGLDDDVILEAQHLRDALGNPWLHDVHGDLAAQGMSSHSAQAASPKPYKGLRCLEGRVGRPKRLGV